MEFYKNKKVFITGHTGFKGAWLAKILTMAGADVTGYALEEEQLSLFNLLGLSREMNSITGDIRDYEKLKKSFNAAKPEIVFHLAAQPIVREGYRIPRDTYEINVMGTVNVFECARLFDGVKSILNVTTDKVYKADRNCVFNENDALGGFDPYSNSKSCSDMITLSYKTSFFEKENKAVSAVRAGNVIGGGDFKTGRIIPDCVDSAVNGREIIIRNPQSVRPYQYVLDALFAYLEIAKKQYADICYADFYNTGPRDYINNAELAQIFCDMWGGASWRAQSERNAPYETEELKIDSSFIKSRLGFEPRFDVYDAVRKTVEWARAYYGRKDMRTFSESQIKEYFIDDFI